MPSQYQVVITFKAQQQLSEIFDYISLHLHSPTIAKKTTDRIIKAAYRLESFPKRFAVIDFGEGYPNKIRRTMAGNYSVFYTIQKQTVFVLGILYSASDFRKKIIEEKEDWERP